MRPARKYTSAVLLLIIILSSSILLFPNTSGSGSQAATFDRIEISVDPSIQGLGGEMTVTVTAFFYGGCCYSLFANKIIPELSIPEGINLTSGPTPEFKDMLTAVAGGEPTTVSFVWVLSCDNVGSFDLTANVETSDCGSRDGEYGVHVIKGATITRPEVYPSIPTDQGEEISLTSEDISLKFKAAYKVGDIDVISASVYFIGSSKDLESKDLLAEGDTLFNKEQEFAKGNEVKCRSDEYEVDTFHSSIPKTSQKYLYFWIEVLDENQNTTTSSVYRVTVQDVEVVNTLNLISFIFLVVSMIILIIILYAGQNLLKKRMEGVESNDRFSVLGPVGRKRFLTDTENIELKPERKWKYIAVGGTIILMLILAVVMAATGYAESLFDQLLNPSGGCWGP